MSYLLRWLNSVSIFLEDYFGTLLSFAGVATAFLSVLILVSPAGAQAPKVNESELIHFGDVVDVDVVGSLEFDWRGRLSPEGYLEGINPAGEPIYGLCRSETEIAVAAASAFSKLLRDPKVIVHIVDRSKRAVVTLDGAVKSPQRFQLRRTVRLRELLILSGGMTDEASGQIEIFRPPNLNCFDRKDLMSGSPVPTTPAVSEIALPLTSIKIADLLRGSDDANVLIHSGDLITVSRSLPVYVIGGVNDPRPILFKAGLTVARAIAMAGGVAKDGNGSEVIIYRRERENITTFQVDLSETESGAAKDPILLPMDIVEVPQRNRATLKIAPVVDASHLVRPPVLPLRIVE